MDTRPTDRPDRRRYELPSKYKFLKVLGEGSYGKVLKCADKETGEIVAIKMPKTLSSSTEKEIPMLRKIKRNNLDKQNIVKYIDCFDTSFGKAIVFESLDISLLQHIRMNPAPMVLSDIRTIIQQIATAFDALKRFEVIHTDVKLDNIMMVDHKRRPFQVKLIDFGLAMLRSEAKKGSVLQPRVFRSPEILLGCHFSEAIDMWALGCAMFEMISGYRPFAGNHQNEIMLSIVRLVGQPADHVLNSGRRTTNYFHMNYDKEWSIKFDIRAQKIHDFTSLDELKEMLLEENNKTEAIEREHCIELLKGMLKVDADERITPREVLTHPFITEKYPSLDAWTLASGRYSPSGPSGSSGPSGPCGPSSPPGPSGPSSPSTEKPRAKSTTLQEDQESAVSESPVTSLEYDDRLHIQSDDSTPSAEFLPSGVILVRPATSENTLLLEDQESEVSESPVTPLRYEDGLHIQSDDSTPSVEFLASGVILVRPATSENTPLLEDHQSIASFRSVLKKMFKSSGRNADSNMKTTTKKDTGTKKKKHFFSDAVSWLKKTFSCRVSPIAKGYVL